MPDNPPTLAIIVPATDAPPTLEACVAAIREAGSWSELIVETEPGVGGPAAARNRGAQRSTAEVLVFVDADVVVHPDALERLRRRFAADPGLAAAFGSYDDAPTATGTVSRFRNLLHHHVHTSAPGPAETFWAGLGAVRRDPFFDAGGFDAGRFPAPAVEDIELGRRLRSLGERIVLDPAVRGTHAKRWSLASMVRTDLGRRGIPWARIQLEERALSSSLNLGHGERIAAIAALAALAATALRRPRAAVAALAVFVAADLPFYRLLARRGGARLALAGVPLHFLHRMVAVASLALAALAHARAGFPRRVPAADRGSVRALERAGI